MCINFKIRMYNIISEGEFFMKVLIIGANGQIGKHLATYMQDHTTLEAVARIRDEGQAEFFKKIGIQTVTTNLEDDIETIAKAACGCDTMVYTAESNTH